MRRTAVLLAVLLVTGFLAAFSGPAQAVADRDCSDFATQAAAQRFYVDQGGPRRDPHRLDADDDGRACDSLPCPCSDRTGSSGSGNHSTGGGHSAGSTRPMRQDAVVTRIVDGDTITVRLLPNGPRRSVRMIGVNTPEVHGTVQCGGPAASRNLKAMLPVGRRVVLRADRAQPNKDRYGRILRYVHYQRKDLNYAQVRQGYAKVLVVGRGFSRVRAFRSAQASARAEDRNSWRTCW